MNKQTVYYEPADDVLNIWLSREKGKKIDYAEDNNGVIIHYTKNHEPVYIEILDASRFLKDKLRGKQTDRSKVSYAVVQHRIK